MNTALRVDVASRSHRGLVVPRNEDAFYQGQYLFAVADGLGGHVAGDVASATALDALKRYDRLTREVDLPNTLGRAVHDANEALRRAIRNEPDLAGMGTTLVALLLSERAAVLANIGDSRAYLARQVETRGASMIQVSEDHTYQHLVAGAAEVPNLPGRLARFLDGRGDGRSPDLTTLRLLPGDRILLCSDGLSSYVSQVVIKTALCTPQDPGVVADNLTALALTGGGHDNVTVIVIDLGRPKNAALHDISLP